MPSLDAEAEAEDFEAELPGITTNMPEGLSQLQYPQIGEPIYLEMDPEDMETEPEMFSVSKTFGHRYYFDEGAAIDFPDNLNGLDPCRQHGDMMISLVPAERVLQWHGACKSYRSTLREVMEKHGEKPAGFAFSRYVTHTVGNAALAQRDTTKNMADQCCPMCMESKRLSFADMPWCQARGLVAHPACRIHPVHIGCLVEQMLCSKSPTEVLTCTVCQKSVSRDPYFFALGCGMAGLADRAYKYRVAAEMCAADIRFLNCELRASEKEITKYIQMWDESKELVKEMSQTNDSIQRELKDCKRKLEILQERAWLGLEEGQVVPPTPQPQKEKRAKKNTLMPLRKPPTPPPPPAVSRVDSLASESEE